jgi:hypothetical protein
MFGLKTFVAGLLAGSVSMLLAMQFHLIRTAEGFTVVPRAEQPPLRSTYVDVRRWNAGMWKNYPEVSEALIKAGREDVMATGATDALFPDSSESTLQDAGRSGGFTRSIWPANDADGERVEQADPGGSISESTRKAIQALVPIRFTQPQEEITPGDDRPDAPDSSHRIPAGLPVLQRPVPIPEEALRSSEPASSDRSGAEPQADWVRGLLRSLIPREDRSPGEAEHGHARPAFDLNAPEPEEEVLPSHMNWSASREAPPPAPVRAIRPF